MKKILFGFLLTIHTAAIPQVTTNLQVTCFPLRQLAEVLTEFKEEPFAVGKVERTDSTGVDENNMFIFVNSKTGSWTLAEKHKSGLYCILTGGSDFTIIKKGEQI